MHNITSICLSSWALLGMETMHSDNNPYSFVKMGLLNIHAFAKAYLYTLYTLLQVFLNRWTTNKSTAFWDVTPYSLAEVP
jgi:hypothetical protein